MYLLPVSVTGDNSPTKSTATRLKGTSINSNRFKGPLLTLPFCKCHMIDNVYGCHAEVLARKTRVVVL